MRPTGGKYFATLQSRQREGRVLAAVRVRPVVGGDVLGRVRGVAQRVVGGGPVAAGDPVDLGADGEHGVAEPVELPA